MSAAIEAVDLVKTYPGMPRNAIDGLSFAVEPGSIVGLLGPNGAGKTTLTKLVCGVTAPTHGQIAVFGLAPTAGGGAAKRALSVVHQAGPFDMMLPALDNLRIAAAFKGLRWRRVSGRVAELLDAFGLTGRENQLVFTLSGGERRRLQIIRAILEPPRLLLLDEPSAGLDASGRLQVWSLISDLRDRHGTTVLWTSHYIEELERQCERVLIIDRGRLVRYAAPRELTDQLGGVVIVLRTDGEGDARRLGALARGQGVATRVTGPSVGLTGPDVRGRLPGLLAAAHDHAIAVAGIEFTAPSLEEVFLELTGGRS